MSDSHERIAEIRSVAEIRGCCGKYRVRRGGWARHGAVGEGWGNVEGRQLHRCQVRVGRHRKRVERGEDERHLPSAGIRRA